MVTATMTMLLTPVRRTDTTVHSGLMAESSLAPARGTGMAGIGAEAAITVEATTDAGFTVEAVTVAEPTGAAVMPEAATPEADLNSTVVDRAVAASTAEVAAVPMAEAGLTAEGAANQVFKESIYELAARCCQLFYLVGNQLRAKSKVGRP